MFNPPPEAGISNPVGNGRGVVVSSLQTKQKGKKKQDTTTTRKQFISVRA